MTKRAKISAAPFLITLALWGAAGHAVTPLHAATDPRSIVSEARPDFMQAPAAALSSIKTISPASWSPDGRYVLYVSDESGVDNVWITDVETRASRAIAPSDQPQSGPEWAPDSKHVLFIADQKGDEIYDVFVADIEGGRIRNVTQTPHTSESDASWAPDGRSIVFSARGAHRSAGEIGVVDVQTGHVRMLTHGASAERTRVAPIWPVRGDFIYFSDVAWSFTDANIMRVPVRGGSARNLTPHHGELVYSLEDISPDGEWLLATSDSSNGWRNIALIRTRDRTLTWITNETANHFAGVFAPNGAAVTFARDDALQTQIFSYDLRAQSTRQLTSGNGLHELGVTRVVLPHPPRHTFSPDGISIVYRYQSGVTPPELRVLRMTDGREETLVPNPLSSEIAHGVVQPSQVWLNSSDGKFSIPALVWVPPNLQRDGSHPGIVEIHGGPMDQTRPTLLSHIQVLATRGYVVISPNYRGSSNYSREFFVANRADMGGADLDDVALAADWLAHTGYVNPRKIGGYGASNGAYLTLLALAKQPQRWAAGAALYPFVDYPTEYASEAPWMQAIDRVLMGDPVRSAALWRDRSPLTHADRIVVPVLMTAGANDPRCPPEQAREMARAIRSRGGIVDLRIFGEQGHGAQDVDAYTDENALVVSFFDQHLRARGATDKPQ
ncbi:MAG TPA: S9 family peptidase [Candidatus Paceibacterota bacterium]|nr:S9 family peptidase [Candidatus Paceibacterota bacterium]